MKQDNHKVIDVVVSFFDSLSVKEYTPVVEDRVVEIGRKVTIA